MCNKYVSVQGEGEKEFEVQERGNVELYITLELGGIVSYRWVVGLELCRILG